MLSSRAARRGGNMFEKFDARRETRVLSGSGGVARMVSHQDRYVATRASTPRLAAREYLGRYGELFGIRRPHLKDILQPVAHRPTDAKTEYRFAAEKRHSDLATVVFQQTFLGLPVWEAGLSVTMKHKALHVIGARSTLHAKVKIGRSPATYLEKLPKLDVATLAGHLGLARHVNDATPLRINNERLMVHQHDEARLRHASARPRGDSSGFHSGAPSLPLPPPHASIRDREHYVVRVVNFSFDFPPIRPLHWLALIETRTGSVLLLRPFIDNVTALVFPADPATLGGPAADAGNAALDRLRSQVTLPGLAAARKGVQELRGKRVRVADVIAPSVPPPTVRAGKSFAYEARSNHFAAVNAYYNCERVFQLIERLGFSVADYFPNTKFPMRVDHRGHYGKTKPLGVEINAHCAADESGTGIAYTTFSLADTKNLKQPIGIACDWRVVLHELLGHGVLYNHIGSPRFKFSHSAGDSFAVVMNDPDSKANDRYATLPWLSGLPKDQQRRHDRTAADGWGWGGDIAMHPLDPDKDWGGYNNEQILSSTMFRFYRAIGGDSRQIAERRIAADMTCRIMLAAIQSMTAATSPLNAAHFASALMKAETADWPSAGIAGGAYHKVIRWAFEKQGLYQHGAAKRPNNDEGVPPPVDVYIEDGRCGGYQYQPEYWICPAIWNRRRRDRGFNHEVPVPGVVNYAYLKIKNRGYQTATKVMVRAFSSGLPGELTYPRDWQPMKTAKLKAPNVPANSSAEIVVGPFAWVPTPAARNRMLMVVSALGDSSNIDNLHSRIPMPNSRLVAHDNNIGQRDVATAQKAPQRRARV
jgi:hypothetical protein